MLMSQSFDNGKRKIEKLEANSLYLQIINQEIAIYSYIELVGQKHRLIKNINF